jgi:AcrR family transcriptional regulator
MGIQERKQREFEKRKQLILKTARELFSQKGFNNVTLEDIATKIEFSKGTIYSHFDSKEEIYAHLLLDHLNMLLDFLKESARTSKSTIEGIQKCMNVYIDFYRNHKEYFQLLFFIDIFSNHYRIPQHILKKIQAQKVACLSELQYLLKRGAESKEISNNFSLKNVALVLWGMINGVIHLAESKQIKPADLDKLISVGFEIVKKGLKGKKEIFKE